MSLFIDYLLGHPQSQKTYANACNSKIVYESNILSIKSFTPKPSFCIDGFYEKTLAYTSTPVIIIVPSEEVFVHY